MRYLGNKDSMMPHIYSLLEEQKLLNKQLTFCDAFCGSGAVAYHLKNAFNTIVINDNLLWSVYYTYGRLIASKCDFKKLGFDPIKYLNNCTHVEQGFFYLNYSPGGSNRMYFTEHNAARIDYFRNQIELWWQDSLLSLDEYRYLLACLIESVSSVSNTAGVYGAYLKKWDSRALKSILLNKFNLDSASYSNLITYNSKLEDVIESIECDILYLDPPYTQNQYGTQYHILETLILNDHPVISRVTGSRSTAPMRSDWSKKYKANILLDKILSKTNAKYVILSYNNDGIMSKEFIEASMKRYGKPDTFLCKQIMYKKYQNWKSSNQREHFEYLFFIELEEKNNVQYESPLNYIGSKARIVKNIKENAPSKFTKFIDAFGGGFNVGINFNVPVMIYNDINFLVKRLVESFRKEDTYEYLLYMDKNIRKFGLEQANSKTYLKARNYYNSIPHSKQDIRLLFLIILYGYQQQIRFNSKYEFNNPVGMRWFNEKVLEKMISFSRVIKERDYVFFSKNYTELEPYVDNNTFVYIDPPYQLTLGTYNDGKRGFLGWNSQSEEALFSFLNNLTSKKIPFMLSYVIEHKGKINNNLIAWVKNNQYNVIELGDIIGISGSRRKEVLITNYD